MTYTFKCVNEECEHIFDIEKGMNEEIEIKCEKCGSEVKRVFGAITPIWKCSGAFGKS